MYDALSGDYDRFVNWDARLAGELPFLVAQLPAGGRVLDAATGTGMHAIALARQGFRCDGADLSAGMIARARENAARAGVDCRFEAAGFGSLAETFGTGQYDALLCLGNSLPHVLADADLAAALADFAAVLRPGGVLVTQNRNFDAVLASRERWMEPQSHDEDGREWVFLRFYDFEPGNLIAFHVITLYRARGEAWQQRIHSTHLYPWRAAEMETVLRRVGFGEIAAYGNLAGAPFDPASSGNYVAVARKG